MKKIIMTMSLLCAALSTRAYQEVYGWGYCTPVSESWIQGEGYISPSVVNLNYDEPSATFKAAALDNNAGWKVAAWYYSRSYDLDVAKKMIPGSEERGESTWTDDKESNIVCLYVKYAYITYKVKYLGDGNGIPSGTYSFSYTNELRLAGAPSRSGYTFAGWEDGSGKIHQPGDSVSGASFPELNDVHADGHEVVLTAKWNVNTYTIRFDGNGATEGSMSDLACTYDQSTNLTKNALTKPAHDFVDWTTEQNGTGSHFSDEASVKNLTATDGAVVTLYAQWKVRQHQVTVGVDPSSTGRGNVTPTGTSYYGEGASVEITATANPGFDFKEWADGSTDNPRTVTVTGPATYNAVFEHQGYTLKVYPCGGVYAGETKPVEFRELYPFRPQTTNFNEIGICTSTNGAPFSGYYSGENGSGTRVYDQNGKWVSGNAYWTDDGKYKQIGNLSVYACWGPAPGNFEVAFSAEPTEAGEIRVDYDGRTVTSNDFALTVIEGSNFVMTATATNSGYSFSCWTNSLGFTTNDNPWTYAAPSVVTNVALFTGNVYKVTFDGQRGFKDTQTKYVTFGDVYGDPETPVTMEGYKLEGWYTEQEGEGDRYDATDKVVIARDHRLYANWSELETYTIHFDTNDAQASGSMSDQIAYCETPTALHSNTYEKTGYTFFGWVTNRADAVKMQPDFVDGATVTDLAEPNETATLYAVWSNNVYWVDFDANGGTGTMPSQEFTYDVTNGLNKCEFGPPAGMEFVGWSNNVLKVVYTNGQPVANLCTGAAGDDRIILTAVWSLPDVGDYSRAMHCTTLKWDPEGYSEPPDWEIAENDEGVKSTKPKTSTYLAATIKTSGTLSFRCLSKTSSELVFFRLLVQKASGTWNDATMVYEEALVDVGDEKSFHIDMPVGCTSTVIGFGTDCDTGLINKSDVYIQDVTWTPDSPAHPEPTDADKATISAAGAKDGKFTLSFESKADFDYNLLTNANLLIDSWGKMEKKTGTGAAITFEPPIVDGLPQLFYKVETVQRQD